MTVSDQFAVMAGDGKGCGVMSMIDIAVNLASVGGTHTVKPQYNEPPRDH